MVAAILDFSLIKFCPRCTIRMHFYRLILDIIIYRKNINLACTEFIPGIPSNRLAREVYSLKDRQPKKIVYQTVSIWERWICCCFAPRSEVMNGDQLSESWRCTLAPNDAVFRTPLNSQRTAPSAAREASAAGPAEVVIILSAADRSAASQS